MVAIVVIGLCGCGPSETTEVRAGDRAFLPATTFVGEGTELREGLNILGSGGRRFVRVIKFLATDAELACGDFEPAAGTCGVSEVLGESNVLLLDLDVRDTLLGDGIGDYEVPREAFADLRFADGSIAPFDEGNLDLARFGDDGGAVSYSFAPLIGEDGPPIEDGAVVAERCPAIDAVFVECE